MALSLIFRAAARPEAVRSALRLGTIQLRNPSILKQSLNLSQFTHHGLQAIALQRSNKSLLKVQNVQVRQAHMDHGLLWTIEKATSVALLGIIPLTVLSPSTIMDDIFAVSVIIHNHWGLEACVIDYVRPVLFGNTIPKIALALLFLFSASVLGGLLYFNHHDIGIGCAIRRLWHIRDKQNE